MESPKSTDFDKNDEDEVTFEEAMEVVGTGYFQYKIVAVGGIIILTTYVTVNVVAFVLPVAQCDLQMDSQDKGRLASVFFVGVIVSCHLWGFLSDTLGRRYILMRCLFVDGVLYIVTMLTSNFYLILFLRFLNGVTSCGGIVSAYAYINEFQPVKFRSQSIMLASFIGTLAYILMPCVAWLVLPATWKFELYPGHTFRPWKLFYVLCGVPSLISSFCLYFTPESPKFLLAKGKKEKTKEILEIMYKQNHKKSDVFPIKNIKINEMEKVGKLEDNQNKVFAVVKLVWDQTVPLLKKPHRFNLTLLLVSFFGTVYCQNGMYVWLPTAINKMEVYQQNTGRDKGSFCDVLQFNVDKSEINDIYNSYEANVLVETRTISAISTTQNSFKINKTAEEEICDDRVDTSVYIIYLTLGAFLTVFWIILTVVIKFANKKYVMMVLALLTIGCEISMKISNDLITVPIKASLMIVGSGSNFPIISAVVVDLFPTNLRAMAGCLTMMVCRIGSVTTHTVSGILIESHCDLLLWLYIVATTVNFISISFLPAKPPDFTEKKQVEEVP